MYLKHFGFEEFPFSLTPNLRFFCNLEAYREVFNTVKVGLANGDGFIKVTGEVGTGKTMLCRKILNSLDSEYVVAYIATIPSGILELQKSIARDLEVNFSYDVDPYQLLELLNQRLMELYARGQRAIVIVDEAHALSERVLEGLRLLSNLETESSKLIQIVLVGQPELNRKLRSPRLRQLAQRITFACHLPALSGAKEGLSYICFRLASAGYHDDYANLFTPGAIKLLIKASRGIPRMINVLIHKALLITYGQGQFRIDVPAVQAAIADTEDAVGITAYRYLVKIIIVAALLIMVIGVGGYFLIKGMQ